MFGNKEAKIIRLNKLIQIIQTECPISQAELARRLAVKRSTICKDIRALEKQGVLVAQDQNGWLSIETAHFRSFSD